MNSKGLTLIELLIVIVVIGIIATFSVTAVSEVLSNSKKDGFIVNTETFLNAARKANNMNDSIYDDGVVTLRELLDNEYLEYVGKDPWGGDYDLDASYISAEEVVVSTRNNVGRFVLSNTISPIYLSADVTTYIYKTKIVTSVATLGFETPLEDFSKSDIVFLDGSNNSIIEQVVEFFDNDFEDDVVTEGGDDTIEVQGDIQADGSVSSGAGNDTLNIGSDIEDSGSVDTGAGNDTINVGGKIEENANVETGTGNDEINVSGNIEDNAEVNTGDGDDIINVEGEVKNQADINTGDGNDTVNISDDIQDNTNVNTGAGDDTVTVGDDLQNGAVLNTGEGADTVTIEDDLEKGQLLTGSGNDSVTVDTLKSSSTIDTGDDNDTVYLRDVTSNFKGSVSLGSGNDTLTIIDSSSSANLRGVSGMFYGGSGDDTLNLPNITEAEWNANISNLFNSFETVNLKDTTINP